MERSGRRRTPRRRCATASPGCPEPGVLHAGAGSVTIAGAAALAIRPRREASMKRLVTALSASALLCGLAVWATAAAQETPVCGPPGGEVPATIVGAGTINGTPGNDVIVGSPGVDRINGGP